MSHMDASLDTVIVGYDIDGRLTEEESRMEFVQDSVTREVTVGIITGRSNSGMEDFLESHPDIQRDAKFTEASRVKVLGLREVKSMFPGADKFIYKGSGPRDRVAAMLAGWDYDEA